MTNFDLEYEILIKNLKSEFLSCKRWELYCAINNIDMASDVAWLRTQQDNYREHLQDLRRLVRANFHLFDARSISSLAGIPTQLMDDEERVMHRIWMGGPLPAIAISAIEQWQDAIDEVEAANAFRYQVVLWVWDAGQLNADPLFAPGPEDEAYMLGSYAIGQRRYPVRSLRALAACHCGQRLAYLEELHEKRYYVNLADFFRLLILRDYGGIYLDVDTIPYKSATIFLTKPEVPDYLDFRIEPGSGDIRQYAVSWLNLFKDENGMLVAKKGNASVRKMVGEMMANFSIISGNIPGKSSVRSKDYASALHDATYGVWQKEIGHAFLSYGEMEKRHSVLYDERQETTICGLLGMRLVLDAITCAPLPLSAEEQAAYDRCMDALQQRDWLLDDILELERIGQVTYIDEVPRMAYAPQLRAQPESCHYYSFLSHDRKLDKVNTLFSAYLMAKNAEAIRRGDFWRDTRGQSRQGVDAIPTTQLAGLLAGGESSARIAAPQPRASNHANFVPGSVVAEKHKNRMAALLFSTSYLEYCSFNNKLNLPLVELQRRQNIDQYIGHVYGMFDYEQNFTGFFTGGTIAEFNEVKAVSYYRDEMKAMDDAYDEFISRNSDDSDYFVASLALESEYRGKGLFNTMFAEIERLAREKGSRRIILTVWEQSEALRIYLKKGFKVCGRFEYAYNLFFDRLNFLEYDVRN